MQPHLPSNVNDFGEEFHQSTSPQRRPLVARAAFNQKPLAPPVGVIAVAVAVALAVAALGNLGLDFSRTFWVQRARCFVDRHAMKLRTRLVWVLRAGDCVFASNSQTILARNITNAIAAI